MNIYEQLAKPFPANRVHWRIGSTNQKKRARETGNQNARPTKGKPLAYIDARDVMQRLDDVMGPENWQARYSHADKIVVCEIGLYVSGVTMRSVPDGERRWVWKANGAGETQVEGEKGSCSDAFKRAAVLWGIGRYLYAIDSPWVELDQYGKFTPPELPWWALPERYMEFLEKRKHA